MKNLILAFSFLGFFSGICFAQVPDLTKKQQLNQLFVEYGNRFMNGKYISDKRQIQDFNFKQESLAADLKRSGNLRPIFFITNDFNTDLTVNLFALTDEQNNLLGLFYEKSNYYDDEERSYLRFFSLTTVADGLKFVSVNGSHALIVKGHYFSPNKGGTLQFNYLKDLRNNSWGALNVFLLNRGQGWELFNLQYQPVKNANVKTWTSFFPPNGGVTDIVIN